MWRFPEVGEKVTHDPAVNSLGSTARPVETPSAIRSTGDGLARPGKVIVAATIISPATLTRCRRRTCHRRLARRWGEPSPFDVFAAIVMVSGRTMTSHVPMKVSLFRRSGGSKHQCDGSATNDNVGREEDTSQTLSVFRPSRLGVTLWIKPDAHMKATSSGQRRRELPAGRSRLSEPEGAGCSLAADRNGGDQGKGAGATVRHVRECPWTGNAALWKYCTCLQDRGGCKHGNEVVCPTDEILIGGTGLSWDGAG